MDDDEIDDDRGRPRVAVRRIDPGRSLDPAVVDVRRVPAHPITDNR